MSLVNAETGELVDIADAEEAREIIAATSGAIAHMNAWTAKAIEQIVQAWERKVWIAEGLGSWDELVEAKNWHWRPNTQGERSAVAEIFRQKGFSLRAIGTVLASGQQTIARDLAGVPNGTPAEIRGTDGKTYSATQPERPAPESHECDDCGASLAYVLGDDYRGVFCPVCDAEQLAEAMAEQDDEIEDDDSDGTPDAVDAVSSPTEEVDADRQPASTPLVSAEGVAGETLPSRSLPVTPSVEDHIAELRADGNWSVEFDKATRQIVAPVRYLAADVIERASAEDLADLDDRVARLNEWLDEVRALRPQGLRVIHGGAS
jgi:uncharacterized Zn finger protein (UPF0148 family)